MTWVSQGNPTMTDEVASIIRARFRSRWPYHEELMDLCFKRTQPPCLCRPLTCTRLAVDDLATLSAMVKLELLAGLEKDRTGPEELDSVSKPDPHVFDIYVMETTFEQMNRSSNLAICVSYNNNLVWYDGGNGVWGIDPPSHKWRVSSLSGAARILDALEPQNMAQYPLMKAAMDRTNLVDVVEDITDLDDRLGSIVKHLNIPQRQAVATVASSRFQNGFFAIQGPPGCGKTTVITAMIAVMNYGDGGVLVAAPSNAALANVAVKAYTTLKDRFDLIDFAVYGENCDPLAYFLSPTYRGKKFQAFIKEYDSIEIEAKKEALKRDFVHWLQLDETRDYTVDELNEMCPHIDSETHSGRVKLSILLSKAKVVFSTLNSTGSMMIRKSVNSHTLFLDEAGQCPEAEFFIATTLPSVRRIVVVGDPKQLPSTVISMECRRMEYGVSWLSRVHRLLQEKVHLLSIQYRMDPLILEFPNREFYGDRIKSAEHLLQRTRAGEPFKFIDTAGHGNEESRHFSWANTFEAAIIQNMLFADPDIILVRKDIERQNKITRIIVITPYKAQVKLLREMLKQNKGVQLDISTVDSFQGQEAHVVVYSSVRTHRVGFTDSPERINVALTRAMSVLRVVGSASFFRNLDSSSTLRKMTEYADSSQILKKTQLSPGRWSRQQEWSATLWRPIMSSKFYHCLKPRSDGDRNLFFNTFHAVANGNEDDLSYPVPQLSKPYWYTSSLRGFRDWCIVWYACANPKPTVVAEFAGTISQCRRFIQMNPVLPRGTLIVGPGLKSMQHQSTQQSLTEIVTSSDVRKLRATRLFWKVTNTNFLAVATGEDLPLESVQLDPEQEFVARTPPPLLIESRSGTGKTLVLLQHAAAFFTDDCDSNEAIASKSVSEPLPALFVTVSPRLCKDLEEKYKHLNCIEQFRLPLTMFFSFDGILERLLLFSGIDDFSKMSRCSYASYELARKSHEKSPIASFLIESEIGGVIMGSLEAAIRCRNLTREEYMNEFRSNVGRDTEHDRSKRTIIYDCFERYKTWKMKENKFDIGDLVLRLLKKEWTQCFRAAYIDEIQDLSYAAVKLLCTIAGRDTLSWICAGDPAQMISSGCSFAFAGLKQTLLSLETGIEKRLSKVTQLLVNYRTSRDVLVLGNEVLGLAKKHFPSQIPFSLEEQAAKDFGVRVVLCPWKKALREKVRPGTKQAVVYSSHREGYENQVQDWIGEHPFILSSLQSKGLEFDDVLVAFDLDRKAWKVHETSISSLNMLRELYVAITRAKRRVVILLDESVSEMIKFFNQFSYDFQVTDIELVLQEFNKVVTPKEWFERGRTLFDSCVYQMAFRCFQLANRHGWYYYARGKSFISKFCYEEAASEFLSAIPYFAQEDAHGEVLELGVMLAKPHLSKWIKWDEATRKCIDLSLRESPRHLTRRDAVRLAVATDQWDRVTIADLKIDSLTEFFMHHQDCPSLRSIITNAGTDDLVDIEPVLPKLIGRFYEEKGDYLATVRTYLFSSDSSDAINATECAINDAKTGSSAVILHAIVTLWKGSEKTTENSPIITKLIELFNSPTEAAATLPGTSWFELFGPRIIIAAVDSDSSVDRTLLHRFHQRYFKSEVLEVLSHRYKDNPVKIVEWFLEAKNDTLAKDYAEEKMKAWPENELIQLVALFVSFNVSLPQRFWNQFWNHAERKNCLPRLILSIIGDSSLTIAKKEIITQSFVQSKKTEIRESSFLSISVWCLGALSSSSNSNSRKRSPTAVLDHASNAMLFGKGLLNSWPQEDSDEIKSSRSMKETFPSCALSISLCQSVLETVISSVDNKNHRNKILHACHVSDPGHNATTTLVKVALKYGSVPFALDKIEECLHQYVLYQIYPAFAKKYEGMLTILLSFLQSSEYEDHVIKFDRPRWNTRRIEIAFFLGKGDVLASIIETIDYELKATIIHNRNQIPFIVKVVVNLLTSQFYEAARLLTVAILQTTKDENVLANVVCSWIPSSPNYVQAVPFSESIPGYSVFCNDTDLSVFLTKLLTPIGTFDDRNATDAGTGAVSSALPAFGLAAADGDDVISDSYYCQVKAFGVVLPHFFKSYSTVTTPRMLMGGSDQVPRLGIVAVENKLKLVGQFHRELKDRLVHVQTRLEKQQQQRREQRKINRSTQKPRKSNHDNGGGDGSGGGGGGGGGLVWSSGFFQDKRTEPRPAVKAQPGRINVISKSDIEVMSKARCRAQMEENEKIKTDQHSQQGNLQQERLEQERLAQERLAQEYSQQIQEQQQQPSTQTPNNNRKKRNNKKKKKSKKK